MKKVAIIGAGPAGLYASILLKRLRPDLEVSLFEQNKANATFGFGVVFSDQALAFLREDDPETADLIEPAMLRWSNIEVAHKGQSIAIDGIGFAAIERLKLLQLLQQRASELGIKPSYQTTIRTLEDLGDADLIIGADGLNSMVRKSDSKAFGERVSELDNVFIWFGAEREFNALTQTFVETPIGKMNAHHYPYKSGRSTFIIEMAAQTFERSGLAYRTEDESKSECESYFKDALNGARLVANNSTWRQFPKLSCEHFFNGNQVLVGDALHTAHFSIGSGTRLALEDVVALMKALRDADWQIGEALPAYQQTRKPILDKITNAANASAAWYESYESHMELQPWEFALSYIRRAGRIKSDRLRTMAPEFTTALEQQGIDLE